MRDSFDIDFWQADGHTMTRHPASSTELEWGPQFSPDGKRIAFESDRSGPQEIWVANPDGTHAIQLTHFGRHSGSPSWSLDGRWISFDAYNSESGDRSAISSGRGFKQTGSNLRRHELSKTRYGVQELSKSFSGKSIAYEMLTCRISAFATLTR